MKLIDLHLEESPVGSGRRFFFVVREGHKYAHLFYPPTLAVFTVPLDTIKRAPEVEPSRKLAKTIKTNLKDRERWGYRITNATREAVKAVLAELKGGA